MLLRVPLALGLVVPLILLGLRTWDGTHPRLLATAAWQNIGVGAGGERRLLESPSNITATHRGVWHKLTFPAPASDLGWLQQSTGIAVIKLRIVGSPEVGGARFQHCFQQLDSQLSKSHFSGSSRVFFAAVMCQCPAWHTPTG